MTVRITCINKDNGDHDDPHEAITRLGWENVDKPDNKGYCSRLDMVKFLDVDKGQAFVEDSDGNKAYLIAYTSVSGKKCVKTRPDQTVSDNLLSLTECPIS